MQNKIVVRFADGRLLKGNTADFGPERPMFHVTPATEKNPPAAVEKVKVADLKAVFFVKDFAGDPSYNELKTFGETRLPQGRRIQVEFKDGEILVGTTTGYQPGRVGFFLVPADPKSNNDRCFVVAGAVKEVKFL